VDFAEKDIDDVLARPVTANNWRGKLTEKNQTMVRLEKENLKSNTIEKKLFILKELRKSLDLK